MIEGLEGPLGEGVIVFHAGTARKEGRVVTNGGRVVGITGLGSDFGEARGRAYQALQRISFQGMHYRRDVAKFTSH